MSTANETRTTERLLALMAYELETKNGIGPTAHLERLLEFAGDIILNPGGDDDLTQAQLDRCRAESLTLAKHVVLALVEMGRSADIERHIEDCAARRRECEAKFKMPREIPFSEHEQTRLSAAWDACRAPSETPESDEVNTPGGVA